MYEPLRVPILTFALWLYFGHVDLAEPPPDVPSAPPATAESAAETPVAASPTEAPVTAPAEAPLPPPAEVPVAPPAKVPAETPAVHWHTDYAAAVEAADREKKMLAIQFFDPANPSSARFDTDTLADARIVKKLDETAVCAKLPLDAQITDEEGHATVLLQHNAFREMRNQPGVAILDFAHPQAKYHGAVVSTFPLSGRFSGTPEQMLVVLDLPPGTLTQRTMIYAVRTHPERPASTSGEADARLLAEAESHCDLQARIRRQGHHQWASRFSRINALLPGGLVAREIVAESWPGQGLLEAAIECVQSWRSSQGHWRNVRSYQRVFAYDMKLGSNGIWYATGIFGCGQ